MTNNKYFDKMYNLNPSNWKLRAAVILEQFTSPSGNSEYFYEVYSGDMLSDEALTHYTGKCQHCNHNHTHFVVMEHKTSSDFISIGWQCYNETFALSSREELNQSRAKKLAEAKAERLIIKAKKDAYTEKHSQLVQWLEDNKDKNYFYASLLRGLNNYGQMTDKQENAAYKAKSEDEEKAKTPKVDEIVGDAPKGRISGIFTVLGTKVQENDYGTTLKMVAKHIEDNYKIWVSVPTNFKDENGGFWGNSWHIEKGMKISMNVTIEPSKDDKSFGFGKRPAKAVVIA